MECTHRHTCSHMSHTHDCFFSVPHSSIDPFVLWDKTLYLNLILHEVLQYSVYMHMHLLYGVYIRICTVLLYCWVELCYASFWAHAVFCSYGKIFFAKVLEPPYKGTIYNMGRPHRSNYIVSKLGHSSIIESD